MCYLPYIAQIQERDGKFYSNIKVEAPNLYWQAEVVIGQKASSKPSDPCVAGTPLGGLYGDGFTFAGWCTKDGQAWDLDNDIVQEDMTIYPIWKDASGNLYYPAFFGGASGTGTSFCNSIRQGSIALYNDAVIGEQ